MKRIYCSKCQSHVATLAPGSKVQKGLVYICPDCIEKRSGFQAFADMFDGLSGGKK